MNKFILKISAFSLIIITFIVYFGGFMASNPDDYLAILIDKHKIAESIKTPKIILVGGSNLAWDRYEGFRREFGRSRRKYGTSCRAWC